MNTKSIAVVTNSRPGSDCRAPAWISLSEVVRVLVIGALMLAIVGKAVAPMGSGVAMATNLEGLGLPRIAPMRLWALSLVLDIGLIGGLLWGRTPRVHTALLVAGSLLVSLHVLAYWNGDAGQCGCFGTQLEVPRYASLLCAGGIAFRGVVGLRRGVDRKSALRSDCLAAALLISTGSAAWVVAPNLEEAWGFGESKAQAQDSILARDRKIYVFSPSCDQCLVSASLLSGLAARGEVVGVMAPGMGDVEEFFAKIGFRFPVETLVPGVWFGLLYPSPPGYYYVDEAGKLTRLPKEVFFTGR